jgi:hypothetical protein
MFRKLNIASITGQGPEEIYNLCNILPFSTLSNIFGTDEIILKPVAYRRCNLREIWKVIT